MNANVLGKNRGIKFGMPAIKQIMMLLDKKEDNDFFEVAMLYEMLYWGLRNNCYIKNEEPDFTKEQVCDWVDINIRDVKFFEELGNCFKSASIIREASDKLAAEGEKKSTLTSKRKKAGTD